jgi:hypothetical protein
MIVWKFRGYFYSCNFLGKMCRIIDYWFTHHAISDRSLMTFGLIKGCNLLTFFWVIQFVIVSLLANVLYHSYICLGPCPACGLARLIRRFLPDGAFKVRVLLDVTTPGGLTAGPYAAPP